MRHLILILGFLFLFCYPSCVAPFLQNYARAVFSANVLSPSCEMCCLYVHTNVPMKLESLKEGKICRRLLMIYMRFASIRSYATQDHQHIYHCPPHKSSRRVWKVSERHFSLVLVRESVCANPRDGCGVEAFDSNPNLCKDKQQAEGRHEESTTSGPVGDGCTA